jgi:hypothetical protein
LLTKSDDSARGTSQSRASKSSGPCVLQSSNGSWACRKCGRVLQSLNSGNLVKHLNHCTGKCGRCKALDVPCEKIGGNRCKSCKDAGIEIDGYDKSRNRKTQIVLDDDDNDDDDADSDAGFMAEDSDLTA